jgi:hypothetical protein
MGLMMKITDLLSWIFFPIRILSIDFTMVKGINLEQ